MCRYNTQPGACTMDVTNFAIIVLDVEIPWFKSPTFSAKNRVNYYCFIILKTKRYIATKNGLVS